MSDDTFDLYLVEDPKVIYGDPDGKLAGFLIDMLNYYIFTFQPTMPVTNTVDFVFRVAQQVTSRRKKIRTLVIGSHGGPDHFYIGKDIIDLNPKVAPKERLILFSAIRSFLAKDARVEIMACFTGRSQELLQRISNLLGGVPVHGYTEHYITTNYFSVLTTLDKEPGGRDVVCLRNKCSVSPSR